MPRNREQVVWDFVQAWIRKADGDLRAAERLIEEPHVGDDHFPAAFHAQQAAEKYLKAFLVRYQIPFPKTHDIGRILDLTSQVDPVLSGELDAAPTLTPFGVEFRYPLDELVSLVEARQAVGIAEQVRAIVMKRLHDYLERDRP